MSLTLTHKYGRPYTHTQFITSHMKSCEWCRVEAALLVAQHTKILRELLVFTVAWSLYVLKTVKLQLRFAKMLLCSWHSNKMHRRLVTDLKIWPLTQFAAWRLDMIHTCPMQPWYTRHSRSYVRSRNTSVSVTKLRCLQERAAHIMQFVSFQPPNIFGKLPIRNCLSVFYFVGNHNTTFVSCIFKVTPIFIFISECMCKRMQLDEVLIY